MPNGYGPHCDSDDSGLGEDRPPTPPTPIDSPALWGATRDTRGAVPMPKALPRLRGSVAVALANPTVKPEPESDDEVMPGAAALFEEHRAPIFFSAKSGAPKPSVPQPTVPGPSVPVSRAASSANPFQGGLRGVTLHINSSAPLAPEGVPQAAGHIQAGPKPSAPKPSRAPSAPHYKAPRHKAPKHNRSRIVGEIPGPLPPPWGPRAMDSATCDIARAHPKNTKFALKTMSFVHGRFGAPRGRYCRVCAKFLALDY